TVVTARLPIPPAEAEPSGGLSDAGGDLPITAGEASDAVALT
ncbi:MAG: hypothetical protein RLZZ326_4430, partial [Planctomycetota bacterium]